MRNKSKKVLSLVAAIALLGATVAFSGCRKDYYKGDALEGYVSSENAAVSNGGFAVEKDGYVYFINGVESNEADNTYGDVVKGALMRIKTAELNAGNYANVDTVVPMLFVAQNFKSGIYIYGDYVYYATPTTDKDVKTGEVSNTYIDFKRAKLDGSETMKNYYYRLSSNSANYRFVKGDNGVVYLLFEEDGALKSYNTETGDTTVLVSGSSLTFYYDMKNLENPNVYYTMGVTYNIDTDVSSTATYNQIYCVNAASTATVDEDEASYTVNVYDKASASYKAYKTYDFDKTYLESVNDEAKATAKENNTKYTATYDFEDYTTYPYVNLGTLVLDGVGSKCDWTVYNNEADKAEGERKELQGYTYAITRYENGGVYYTRTEVAPNNNLYYLPETTEVRNTINANTQADIVAQDTSNASTAALFEVKTENGARTHSYLYASGGAIYKATADANGKAEEVKLTGDAMGNGSSVTLWKTEGDNLYYYASGTNPVTGDNLNGNMIGRIDYTGTADKYDILLGLNAEAKYKPVAVSYVDFASTDSWYLPEIFGNTLLYANAQAFGSSTYNYVYATQLGTSDDVKSNNEKYEEVYEFITSYEDNEDLQDLMTYYYRTGEQSAYNDVKSLYSTYQKDEFDKFVTAVGNKEYILESDLIGLVGEMTEDDEDAIKQAWVDSLLSEDEEEEAESGLEVWQICLIVAACVVVLAAAIAIPVIVVSKKKAKKAEEEATVNAYKRKRIDTTDDKTIDVYADDEAETVEETEEETVDAIEVVPAEEIKMAEEVEAEVAEETAPETEETQE